ncbi:helix-turn-helix transcriptional regulator [Bacillus mycoides]|uniref:helix-turn-helix transcriptional regulator n=1 Tax=Bacillus TaxID=1386 RepID=UPI00240E8F07|nr:YafY family protein [Bacillus cereus]MDG1634594.1 YafY family protein [Bacillus cereus]
MSRSGRLLELLISLNTKHRFTVQELADEFSVSRRTMLRDLQLLSEMGVPLLSSPGPNGGYSLIRKQKLPPISLTAEEATGLLLSYELLEQHDGPFKYENMSTLTKIRATMSVEMLQKVEQLKARLAIASPRRSFKNLYLKDILQASLERKHVEIEYESRSGYSIRTIFPYGLFISNGLWYSLAFCYKRNNTVTFRVDRIVSLKVNQNFTESIPIDMTVEKWLKQPNNSTKEFILKARLTKFGCKILDPHPIGEWIQVNPDGTGVIEEKIKESDICFVGRMFLSLGAEIFIEEPVELIQFLQEEAFKVVNQYSKM